MAQSTKIIEIDVADRCIFGTVVTPDQSFPGVLFVHGWGGNQQRDLQRARDISALGCSCLTFDLSGHASTDSIRENITREDSLRDVLAAYDRLAALPAVNQSAIAVVGSRYGAYLASIVTSMRAVRWLALRAPAIYQDADWTLPKRLLNRAEQRAYRHRFLPAQDNRALRASAEFSGDVLIVESQNDEIMPHPVIMSYIAAFRQVRSLTYRVIEGADHALDDETSRQAYGSLLVGWITEMVLGARKGTSRAQP